MPPRLRWELVVGSILNEDSIAVCWDLPNNICDFVGELVGHWSKITLRCWVSCWVCADLGIDERLHWLEKKVKGNLTDRVDKRTS